MKTVWVDNAPTDRKTLDRTGRWPDMPFLMLAKCAEAQALRKGWPEDLANAYVSEETARANLKQHPAEAAAQGATLERLERVGAADGIIIDWEDGKPLEAVPLGRIADRIIAFIRNQKLDGRKITSWRERNRHALREFWARAPSDALEVKKEIERALDQSLPKPTKEASIGSEMGR